MLLTVCHITRNTIFVTVKCKLWLWIQMTGDTVESMYECAMKTYFSSMQIDLSGWNSRKMSIRFALTVNHTPHTALRQLLCWGCVIAHNFAVFGAHMTYLEHSDANKSGLVTWCASSWATVVATCWCDENDVTSGSKRSDVCLYVIRPQFSIAPELKSGMAIKSGNKSNTNSLHYGLVMI